jgi:hypothetical protein
MLSTRSNPVLIKFKWNMALTEAILKSSAEWDKQKDNLQQYV